MTPRGLFARPQTAFAAFVQLLLCVAAAVIAVALISVIAGEDWAGPLWAEVLAMALSLAFQVIALIMLVHAMHEPAIRTALLWVVVVSGILMAGVLLNLGGLAATCLALIGIAWLEIIRRTWPRLPFRRPTLRANLLEPPERRRAR